MDCGIRPGGTLQLQVEDINIPGSYVTVRAEVSKTRETRIMPLSAQTMKAIIQLIAVRRPIGTERRCFVHVREPRLLYNRGDIVLKLMGGNWGQHPPVRPETRIRNRIFTATGNSHINFSRAILIGTAGHRACSIDRYPQASPLAIGSEKLYFLIEYEERIKLQIIAENIFFMTLL